MSRHARRWPWILLILLFLALGAVVAYAISQNLSGDSSRNGTAQTRADNRALPITEAQDFDPPPGDGSEHPEDTHFAIDGDPRSAWQTQTYSNRNFGNAKPGVGLWVQLDASREISSVTVTTLENGWSAQIYVADQPGSTLAAWGPARATGDDLPASHTFGLGSTRGQYVLIWCTQLPPTDNLEIGDVKVEGR